MNVLVVGVIERYACNNAKEYFKTAKYTTVDADPKVKADHLWDIREPIPDVLKGKFDAVFASHVLEHVEWQQSVKAVVNLANALVKEGKLYIFVPDLKWACQEVIHGRYGLDVIGVFYGGQATGEWDYHKSGYTEEALYMAIERAGMVCEGVTQGWFISVVYGKKRRVAQLMGVGIKQ